MDNSIELTSFDGKLKDLILEVVVIQSNRCLA